MPRSVANVSVIAASQALLVRALYALNGIILTFLVYETVGNPLIFLLNLLLIPSVVEVVITLMYKEKAEWTWVIPSVFIYLLWVVPSIVTLEMVALDFRKYFKHEGTLTSCPVVFSEICEVADAEGTDVDCFTAFGINQTYTSGLSPSLHDQSRRYSMLFQQIMMLVIIIGRWLAPKGKLSRDQLSSLLLALVAMTVDMLEFSTDSLSIQEVVCDKIYVGFIVAVWCWSLLQIPLGLTAVKQRKPRVIGPIGSRDSNDGSGDIESQKSEKSDCRRYWCCCCESEIWALMVSICMQDGPYLVLRLYIIFSSGYFGETLIFFAAKNAIIVVLQSYRILVKLRIRLGKKTTSPSPSTEEHHSALQDRNGVASDIFLQSGDGQEKCVVDIEHDITLEKIPLTDGVNVDEREPVTEGEEATSSVGGTDKDSHSSARDEHHSDSTDLGENIDPVPTDSNTEPTDASTDGPRT